MFKSFSKKLTGQKSEKSTSASSPPSKGNTAADIAIGNSSSSGKNISSSSTNNINDISKGNDESTVTTQSPPPPPPPRNQTMQADRNSSMKSFQTVDTSKGGIMDDSELRLRLAAFYESHDPVKLNDLENILSVAKKNGMIWLEKGLLKKYNSNLGILSSEELATVSSISGEKSFRSETEPNVSNDPTKTTTKTDFAQFAPMMINIRGPQVTIPTSYDGDSKPNMSIPSPVSPSGGDAGYKDLNSSLRSRNLNQYQTQLESLGILTFPDLAKLQEPGQANDFMNSLPYTEKKMLKKLVELAASISGGESSNTSQEVSTTTTSEYVPMFKPPVPVFPTAVKSPEEVQKKSVPPALPMRKQVEEETDNNNNNNDLNTEPDFQPPPIPTSENVEKIYDEDLSNDDDIHENDQDDDAILDDDNVEEGDVAIDENDDVIVEEDDAPNDDNNINENDDNIHNDEEDNVVEDDNPVEIDQDDNNSPDVVDEEELDIVEQEKILEKPQIIVTPKPITPKGGGDFNNVSLESPKSNSVTKTPSPKNAPMFIPAESPKNGLAMNQKSPSNMRSPRGGGDTLPSPRSLPSSSPKSNSQLPIAEEEDSPVHIEIKQLEIEIFDQEAVYKAVHEREMHLLTEYEAAKMHAQREKKILEEKKSLLRSKQSIHGKRSSSHLQSSPLESVPEATAVIVNTSTTPVTEQSLAAQASAAVQRRPPSLSKAQSTNSFNKTSPKEGIPIVQTKSDTPCDNYTLDMFATEFGLCMCGYPKAKHGQPKQESSPSMSGNRFKMMARAGSTGNIGIGGGGSLNTDLNKVSRPDKESNDVKKATATTPKNAAISPKAATDVSNITKKNYRAIVTDFYTKYNPEKLSTLDDIMKQFAGREDLLISKLEAKYGAAPL